MFQTMTANNGKFSRNDKLWIAYYYSNIGIMERATHLEIPRFKGEGGRKGHCDPYSNNFHALQRY